MKKCYGMFNRRFRPMFKKEQANIDPEYLKRKNNALIILKALKKVYPEESASVKKGIETLSQAYRKAYPELNDELPINS